MPFGNYSVNIKFITEKFKKYFEIDPLHTKINLYLHAVRSEYCVCHSVSILDMTQEQL